MAFQLPTPYCEDRGEQDHIFGQLTSKRPGEDLSITAALYSLGYSL